MINKKKFTIHVVGVLLVLLVAAYRFVPAFMPGHTLINTTVPSDGIGTASSVAFMAEQYKRTGPGFLATPFMSNEDVGAGLIQDAFVTIPWKFAYLSLGTFLSPDNVYDGILFISFFLNALMGAFVARAFGLRGLPVYLAGLLFAGLPVFEKKVEGHLGLAIYFVSLAQIAWAKIAATRRDSKSFIIFGLVSALAFVQNEYYGFFGALFGGVFLLTRYALVDRFRRSSRFLGMLVLSGLAFTVVMVVFYAHLLFPESQVYAVSFSKAAHAVNAFQFYSIKDFSEVFRGLPFTHAIANQENVFAVGAGILVLYVVLLGVLWFKKDQYLLGRSRSADIGAIFIAGVVMLLVASNFDSWYALGPAVYMVAPMFRVLLRALLFVDFALIILLFSLFAATLRKKVFSPSGYASWSLLLLAYVSVAGWNVFFPLKAYALPDKQIYSHVSSKDGAVLVLPFYGPDAPPEASYIYLYGYIGHRQPLVNGPFFQVAKTDQLIADRLVVKTPEINTLSNGTVMALAKAGVGVIVLDGNLQVQADLSELKNVGVVKAVINGDRGKTLIKLNYSQDGDFLFDYLLGQDYVVNMAGCTPPSKINGEQSSYCAQNFAIHIRTKKAFAGTITVLMESGSLIKADLGAIKQDRSFVISQSGSKTRIEVMFNATTNIRNNRKEVYIPLQLDGPSNRVRYAISSS